MLAFEIPYRFDDIIRKAEEFNVATCRSDIARDDLFGRETRKIIRSTGLRPCPGQPLAAERLEVPVSACVFTDDLAQNIEGARAAGMQAFHFQGAADMERQLRALGVEW